MSESSDFVVVDASLAIKWVFAEANDEEAMALADGWGDEGKVLAAPALLMAEATNVLYRRVMAKQLSLPEAGEILTKLLTLEIEVKETPGVHIRALELAQEFGLPAAYDAHYLAVAELLDCELWTADEKFYNSVRKQKPQVRLLGGKKVSGRQ